MKTFACHPVFLALISLILSPLMAHASSSPVDSVHFCQLIDYEQWERDHPRPAGKRLANLDVGPPRTVRMIYFLPNDRPFRQEVVDSMKVVIRRVQTFYAEQMQAHGYGNITFRFETDAQGEPLVHRVDGRHSYSHYPSGIGYEEIYQMFDSWENIYFIVGNGDRGGGQGGRHKKRGVLRRFLAVLVSKQQRTNWAMPSACYTISAMVHISCRMVRDRIGYPRARPNFCPFIPTSIPKFHLKKGRRRPSNSSRRVPIRRDQQASPYNSKSQIRKAFTK